MKASELIKKLQYIIDKNQKDFRVVLDCYDISNKDINYVELINNVIAISNI